MKITFAVPELQKQLGQLSAVVARKSEEALYGNVRLFTDDAGIVTLQGIDIDATITVKIPSAKADGKVNILLVFTVLNEVVQSLITPEVSIVYKNEQESILTSGKLRVRLHGAQPVEKFLDLPVVNGIDEKPSLGGYTFGLPGLKEQIDQVDFSVPAPGGKFVVPSALLVSTSDTLSVVATDGIQLATSSVSSNLGEFAFTLPKPALELIKKLAGGTTVTISDTEGAFYIETELELVTYNKTHSEFPPYTRIIPAIGTLPTCVVITAPFELVSAIRALKSVCGDKEKPGVAFSVKEGGNSIALNAVNSVKVSTGDLFTEMGINREITAAITGPAVTTILDAKRLTGFLERAVFPLTLYIKDGCSILDMHANGGTPEKPTYRFLMMPMRGEGFGVSSEVNTIPAEE